MASAGSERASVGIGGAALTTPSAEQSGASIEVGHVQWTMKILTCIGVYYLSKLHEITGSIVINSQNIGQYKFIW